MDTIPTLIETLKRDGIIVFLMPNYGLRTKGNLTDSLRENIRASKNELVSYLICQQKLLWRDSFQTLLTMPKPKFIREERWEKIKTWACLLGEENMPYIDQWELIIFLKLFEEKIIYMNYLSILSIVLVLQLKLSFIFLYLLFKLS